MNQQNRCYDSTGSLRPSEVEAKLINILNKYSDHSCPILLETIWDLVATQGSTSGPRVNEIRKMLYEWLVLVWDRNDPDNTDSCMSIAANMEINKFYQYASDLVHTISNPEVLLHIQEYKNEFCRLQTNS